MDDVKTQQRRIKVDAAKLLESVGISRIVVVDDEYAGSLADLLGILSEFGSQKAEKLQHLGAVNFENTEEVWKHDVGEVWESLSHSERQSLLLLARTSEASVKPQEFEEEASNPQEDESTDTRAATCLEEVLGNLPNCEFITLSYATWKERSHSLLNDDKASATILLFDRDLSKEGGSPDEGLKLLQGIQSMFTGYCGLITHTVSIGEEPESWESLASEYRLDREKFVIISKERLNSNTLDYFGFLGMLWLVAMSRRHLSVREKAWSIFERSVARVKEAVGELSPLDFDRIVFKSSRDEGVSEYDTLFRVFSILMRREAQEQLREDESFRTAIEDARSVSIMPESIATALGKAKESRGALRVHRFEMYEHGDELNKFHAPLELGDIFENVSNNKKYILLTQPCDLMVRNDGKRSHDHKFGRMGTLIELIVDYEEVKKAWEELPFYEEESGKPAYVSLTKAHQVQISVLDLCVVGARGEAEIDVEGECPDLLIEPWKQRYNLLKKHYGTALKNYRELVQKEVGNQLAALSLPRISTTFSVSANVNGSSLRYGIKRVLRLRQPWSSALLTTYSQHQARAAFEHKFEQLEID